MLISVRSGGDGAPDRLNLVHSEISNSSSVDGGSRPFPTAFGLDLNLMHPQSIFAVLPSKFLLLNGKWAESLYELLLCGWIYNWRARSPTYICVKSRHPITHVRYGWTHERVSA